MKTKTFVKQLLCLVMVSVMLLGASVSASAVGFETEDIALTDNDTEIENIGNIDSDIEIGDIEPINNNYVDVEDFILDGQISEFSGDSDASLLAVDNESDEITINLLGLRYNRQTDVEYDEDCNGISDFKTLLSRDELLLSNDQGNYYFAMQGGCTDGVYNYFAFIVRRAELTNPEEPDPEKYKYITYPVDTRIVCYKNDEPDSSRTLYWTTGLMDKLQHINDMTYNSITGEIVIACCYGGYYQQLYTINANEFRFTPSDDQQNPNKISQGAANLNLIRHNVSCMVTSIGFNETRNQYVVGLSKKSNYIAILDSDFNLIKKVGFDNTQKDDEWAGQGLHCDNKYIYLTQFLNSNNATRDQQIEKESRIKIFDWNGNLKRTIMFDVEKEQEGKTDKELRYYEVENMYVVGDRVFLGFSCMHKHFQRTMRYIDITNYTYYIQYCPDENVGNYYEKKGENDYIAKDNDNVKSVMMKGLKTHLYRSRITKSGKEFIGWTAYRANVNKWLYKSPNVTDESTNGWYVEGQQPEGYVKYKYTDTQQVSNTGLGGELVLMCAQWKDTTQFTVRFFSGNTEEKNMKQSITYGVSTPLTKNVIEKDELDFKWWNAYWPEKNMWYYREISNKDKRGWFVEGCEPEGYIKYRYYDEQSVAQTVFAGSNVYMYAVWNEFTVYYNANGVEVEAAGIIDSHVAIHKEEYENYLKAYNTSDLYKVTKDEIIIDEPYKGYELECYYQYWVEEDKWMCRDNTNELKWCSMDTIKSEGYTMYERDPSSYISKTVRAGERLVLYAVWSKK